MVKATTITAGTSTPATSTKAASFDCGTLIAKAHASLGKQPFVAAAYEIDADDNGIALIWITAERSLAESEIDHLDKSIGFTLNPEYDVNETAIMYYGCVGVEAGA